MLQSLESLPGIKFTLRQASPRTTNTLDTVFGPVRRYWYLPSCFRSFIGDDSIHIPLRKRDIMLSTFPRTGTTWLQQICIQIKDRDLPDTMDFCDIYDKSPWFELDVHLEEYSRFSKLNDPRVFKTHLPLSKSLRGCRYLATIRDPAWTFRSSYFFFRMDRAKWMTPSKAICDGAFSEFEPQGATLWQHYRELWQARFCNDVCVIPYEFLQQHIREGVRSIGRFMGEAPLNDSELEQVVERSSRRFMRSEEHLMKFAQFGLGECTPRLRVSRESEKTLSSDAEEALQKLWTEEMTPTTGTASYKEFLGFFEAKLFQQLRTSKAFKTPRTAPPCTIKPQASQMPDHEKTIKLAWESFGFMH